MQIVCEYISAKHIPCPPYRRTRRLPHFKLLHIEIGIDPCPAKAAGLFFADYTTPRVSGRQFVRRILQGRIQPAEELFPYI